MARSIRQAANAAHSATDNVDRVQLVGADGNIAEAGGGGDGLTDAELRAAAVKVDDDATQGLIGEVQASPTANTVLARLKDLLTGIVLAAGTAIIGRVGHDTTGLGDGQQEVATAGTAEALAGSTAAKWVVVTAQPANTGKIAVGASTVVAAAGSERGAILSAGQSVTLLIDNLAEVFVDATVNGEGASFVYGT